MVKELVCALIAVAVSVVTINILVIRTCKKNRDPCNRNSGDSQRINHESGAKSVLSL